MRFPCPHLLAALACAAVSTRAASLDARIEALFRPPLGELMALSPDGHYVAYTTRSGHALAIAILNIENPGPPTIVPVETSRDATEAPALPPSQLRFLRWATASRLVYAPAERIVPLPPVTDGQGHSVPNPDGPAIVAPIMAVDADGRQRGVVVDAQHFQETPADARQSLADLLMTPRELQATRKGPVHWRMPHLDILGFLPSDREQLIIETHGAHSMPMQHLVDLRSGNITEFGEPWPAPATAPNVFDWYRHQVVGVRSSGVQTVTLWRDEDLARVQRELAAKFPHRTTEILDWTSTHASVLFQVSGGRDPGRVFVFQRPEDLVLEIFSRAPWLESAKLHATQFFKLAAGDGSLLSGYLTWPNHPGASPPPLLVVFPSTFPDLVQPAFDPEAQIFADQGLAVVRLNHRGVSATDQVTVEDARAVVDWLATQRPDRRFDQHRVATLGRGSGGELARRAVRLQPKVFRCAIAIDAPLPAIGAHGLVAQSDSDRPHELDFSAADSPEASASTVLHLASADMGTGRAANRAVAYRRIGEFLDREMQQLAVNVQPTKVGR